jgi:hypothetical protein
MEYKEIQSFEAACAASGYTTALPDVSMLPEHMQQPVIAFYRLIVQNEAINREQEDSENPKPIKDRNWKPDYTDGSWKYTPYFKLSGPSGFAFRGYAYWGADSLVGSRLEYRDRERAIHAVSICLEDYKSMMLIQ